MTRDEIVEGFRVQLAATKADLPHQVSYAYRRPLTVMDGQRIYDGWLGPKTVITTRVAVYDVEALYKKFRGHVFIGFHDKLKAFPIIEKLDLYIV